MKNKNNKSNINTDAYAIMIVIVIIVVVILIVGGYLIRNNFNCEGDMFSYAGAVIGGGLTLIGVIFTMMHQEVTREKDKAQRENERKEELAIKYKPVIDIFSVKQENIIQKNRNALRNTEIENKLKNIISNGIVEIVSTFSKNRNIFLSIITFKNFGNGEGTIEFTNNISLDNTKDFKIICKKNIYEDYNIRKGYKIEIPRNYEVSIVLLLHCDSSSIENKKEFKLKIPLTIHDQFNINEYPYLLELCYSINKGDDCLTNIFFDFKAIK